MPAAKPPEFRRRAMALARAGDQSIARIEADHSPATVRKVHRVLSLVLALAVKDGRLARNAAAGPACPGWSGRSGST